MFIKDKSAMTLSPARKADRLKMAAQLAELVRSMGYYVEVKPQWPGPDYPPRTMVRIDAGHATAGISFGKLEASNGYIIPWNIHHDSKATFSQAFGSAVGASVNPFHRRKCMGVVPEWPDVLESVERALQCIKDGWAIHAWRGTVVPAHWIDQRESLTPGEVLKTENVEQRAAGCAIIGWPKMLSVLKAKVIDADPDPSHGELIEVKLPGLPKPGRFLKAECPRNGTICEGVPNNITTVLAAQAWRVGLEPHEFTHPTVRT
jgi:hypothetical protein